MEHSLIQRDRWEKIQAGEKTRNDFIEKLLDQLELAQSMLAEVELQSDQHKVAWGHAYREHKESQEKLASLESEVDSNTFVSVLIDGDCMNFLDDLVQRKRDGGQEAAQKLRSCALNYVHGNFPKLSRDVKILVVVCCNLRGLCKTYVDSKILDASDDFLQFVRGFNMGDPLCYFLDAGPGKECSDHKLRETFQLHVGQLQCKQILFGGSTDNGYARLFVRHTEDQEVRKRVTLVEGPPFATELDALKDKFHQTSFPTVFRDTKISPRRVSFSLTPPPPVSPGPSTYATTASTASVVSAVTAPTVPLVRQPTPSIAAPASKLRFNSQGQRIDAPMRQVSSNAINEMRNRKMCNLFVLRGSCHYLNCGFEHVKNLDQESLAARRIIARGQPCNDGTHCDDEDCFYGHQCPRGRSCEKIESCRWGREMHVVDQKVAL